MNKLHVIERLLTGTVKPNDMSSYSVFIPSRSSLIRQLESLTDLCDGDQSNLSDVLQQVAPCSPEEAVDFCKNLLGLPCHSVEWSFSVLRRLQTWL